MYMNVDTDSLMKQDATMMTKIVDDFGSTLSNVLSFMLGSEGAQDFAHFTIIAVIHHRNAVVSITPMRLSFKTKLKPNNVPVPFVGFSKGTNILADYRYRRFRSVRQSKSIIEEEIARHLSKIMKLAEGDSDSVPRLLDIYINLLDIDRHRVKGLDVLLKINKSHKKKFDDMFPYIKQLVELKGRKIDPRFSNLDKLIKLLQVNYHDIHERDDIDTCISVFLTLSMENGLQCIA